MAPDQLLVEGGTTGGELSLLPPLIRGEPSLTDVLGRSSATLAVLPAATAFVVAGISHLSERAPMLVVTPTLVDAERMVDDLRCLFGPDPSVAEGGTHGPVVGSTTSPVALLPPWETLPFERVSPEISTMGQRLSVLWSLFGDQGGDAQGGDPKEAPKEADSQEAGDYRSPIKALVAPVRAVLQRLSPWAESATPLAVSRGSEVDASEMIERLVHSGYRRELQVEHRGELAVRGGIIDVFPSTSEVPVRIDLLGDEVERLTVFDVADQRSVRDIDTALIFGCREMLPTPGMRAKAAELADTQPWGRAQWERLSSGDSFDGMEAWLPWLSGDEQLLTDLLPESAQVLVIEPRRCRDRAIELYDEEGALGETLSATWGYQAVAVQDQVEQRLPRLHLPFDRLLAKCSAPVLSMPPSAQGPSAPTIGVRGFLPVQGDPSRLATQLSELTSQGYSVTVCAASPSGAQRMANLLAGEGMSVPVVDVARDVAGVSVVACNLSQGFMLPDLRLAVVSEADITGRRIPHRTPRARARPTDGFFDDLAPGSYVVHRQHGVARYAGVTTRTVGGATRDYLVVEYRGSDRLYLPLDQIEAITPYTGGDTPTLSRMGGADWQRARAKARAAAGEIAEELVELYRRRLLVPGHAFAPDTPWQAEMEESFPFVETSDQLRAVQEVKQDMELDRPMDRLVCGDVGFGKTEVALRAAFKAVQDGKQAAVLVPTTLLASQHHQTFADRFAGFPVKVELLSRFLSNSQARSVIEGLADGSVDVVIGTHRLLGSDVRFKQLGLLVVDEEQRFGVSHKETVKRLTEGIDVLTLTASPIPRTLEMALTGIRDLSMVNTPPADRRPILTYVGEQEEAAVSEAIRRELLREGQVFYVHNRVVDIEAVSRRLGSLVPEARIAIAHGQMDEGSLEQVVLDFSERKYDVLVCTTIIESGIDMPTVNTLVVDRADLLGLGQLHQIRGRVGRAGHRAYAYLFYPQGRVLTEQAYERLRTIGEQTELGSGFKIAMRDLQIRGAGNLLGRDQSGHIAAVGYDLYVQLVAEAVAEAKGEPRPEPPSVSLDVPGDAHLPADYVQAEDARLEAYRRLAGATTHAEVDDVGAEWLDRFGPLPDAAEGLLELARLRAECLRLDVTDVAVVPVRIGGGRRPVARLSPLSLPGSAQVRLHRLARDGTYREELRQLVIPLDPASRAASTLWRLLSELVPESGHPLPATNMRGA